MPHHQDSKIPLCRCRIPLLSKNITRRTLGDLEVLSDNKHREKLEQAYRKQKRQEQLNISDNDQIFESRLHQTEENSNPFSDQMRPRYGNHTMVGCRDQSVALQDLSVDIVGKGVSFNARLHHLRSMSADLVFIVFRQNIHTIQGILESESDRITKSFVRVSKNIRPESLVHVKGRLQRPPRRINGCTIHDVEIVIDNLYLLAPSHTSADMEVEKLVRTQGEVKLSKLATSIGPGRSRTGGRIPLLRTPPMHSIFRIKAGICNAYRSALDRQGFIEIHTPKLQPAATESGAQVFKLDYFNSTAFLAQSPQFSKQMAISADFSRVYEIAPVFRGENSNTPRHMTEYIGLDIEMEIQHDYYEALDIIDELFKHIFQHVYQHYATEIAIVKEAFPHDDLMWVEQTPRISYREAVNLLNLSGWKDDSGNPASPEDDLGTKAEVRLGELIKERYKTDYYILDKFPKSARPFYTKVDADSSDSTNSFDIFIRGQEVASGGERINNPHELLARMKECGIDPQGLSDYVQAFKLAMPPHAGCGIGLERVVFLMLNLGDIRCASLFPRDPKSLSQKKAAESQRLRHPKADTLRYAFEPDHGKLKMPTVEDLIANYGDATNTSWLDTGYNVWRDINTGAAVGYVVQKGFAIVMGNPLCNKWQYADVIRSFLQYLGQEQDLRPIWILASTEVEKILGKRLKWRTLACIAEERVKLDAANVALPGKKERQAERAKVAMHEIQEGKAVSSELRSNCDKRIAEWKANRQGTQVHIADVNPWVDMQHRRYFWAEDCEGEVTGLVVLSQLSSEHGYQIKYALDFPGSTSGSIEALISHAIKTMRGSGVQELTFGAGSTPRLDVKRNISRMRATLLKYAYKVATKQLGLNRKKRFREKFGIEDDPLYVCYPALGLGLSGVRAVVGAFKERV